MTFTSRIRNILLFLVITFFLVLIAGCMEGSKNEGGMLNIPEEGSIRFQAFIEEIPNEGEVDVEYERMQEIISHLRDLNNISVEEVSVHINSESNIEKYGHLIDEFPTYIIIDHSGIVLNTSDVKEITEFIESKQ
ncbi:hypothetical protein [Salinibacillus xinjiangensis]|uniref:Uncharacterized protein n=1 Tax=Salinibacillus xinjiangensis TaxID=1229268 RepID=A0A6G1XA05_9BACI|nr:hypothetical protein [Salinibacillus xinjiangensis]MRG87759.1 hypothetical protein [Salinibacillus xinjiangensis]